jgi:hypothetical protein
MKGFVKQVAVLSLGALAFAAPVHAQMPQFSIGGGIANPLGNFDDVTKMGIHALAAVSFKPATLPVGIQIDGNFAQFPDTFSTTDLKARMLFATGNVVYTFKTAAASRLHPYLIGGVGVYNSKVTGTGAPTGSNTDLGVNGGAGFNIAAGGAAVFVEGRFHNVFTSGSSTQFVPLTVGLRFGGK